MNIKISNRGFTLIELLVVISIISLLTTVVLASLSTARASARDAERIAAVKQIQNALELYALDHGGNYPGELAGENPFTRTPPNAAEMGTNGCGYGAPGTAGSGDSFYAPGIWCKFETVLSPYIKSLPRTFINNGIYYYFTYKVPITHSTNNPNNIKFYGLSTRLERPNAVSQNDGGASSVDFEVGQLPKYCQSLTDPSVGKDWNQWNAYPCSCLSADPNSCGR
jgi:prepilin-type N-terminal cleavage/methylation domain-containing protein